MSNARAVLGAGLVQLALWNATSQTWSEFDDPVDADKFEIKPNFEEKVSTSKSHLDYGQARASVVLPAPTEITIEIAASNVKAFAMQFQGAIASMTQASGTLTAYEITTAVIGENSLGKLNIADSGFLVKDNAGAVTYVLGTDYTVNWARGILVVKAGGAITAGQVLKVTGTYGAVDGSKILGGRNPQVRCKARFDGVNLVDGSKLLVDVHEAVLGASNAFDFLASDFAAIQLTGKIVTPTGMTEGYQVLLPD